MTDIFIRTRRTKALGDIGETLAVEALRNAGFNVTNLNDERYNYPYADVLAKNQLGRFFVSVKSRNEFRDCGKLNESFNCYCVPDAINKKLKASGLTTGQITQLAITQINALASQKNAVPAWITVPIRPNEGTYAVYFGLLSDLGNKRSIPMTPKAIGHYRTLMEWTRDERITPNLTNRV